jgi:hypothetical protein
MSSSAVLSSLPSSQAIIVSISPPAARRLAVLSLRTSFLSPAAVTARLVGEPVGELVHALDSSPPQRFAVESLKERGALSLP